MKIKEIYKRVVAHLEKIQDIATSSAVLSWDQETHMPNGGAERRGQQLSTLAGIHHNLTIDKNFINDLNTLKNSDELSFKEKRNVEEALKDCKNASKFSVDFVKQRSKLISETFQAWEKARESGDFNDYAPKLEAMVKLKRKEASLCGFIDHPYDALIEQFETGMTCKDVEKLFDQVKSQLVPFVKEIANAPMVDDSCFNGEFKKDDQWNFGLELLKELGFDFNRGRQDLALHPFSTSFSSDDVRITTRIKEDNLSEMIWSCIHEGGHAIYEQGLPSTDYGLGSGTFVSLSIHESQSRFYENNIGRSKAYWTRNLPLAKKYFSKELETIDTDSFYKAMNKVEPSLIRTSADELTYHFHVLIRFEIEKGLLDGSYQVKDLPSIWNAKYKEYLNIEVPNDNQGVLQDIHWAHGAFGYFPTYSLGSFYAAQFYDKMQEEIPHLNDLIEKGEMSPIKDWLNKAVHQHGKLYSPNELCKNITGEELNFKYFMNYVKNKYEAIYSLETVIN